MPSRRVRWSRGATLLEIMMSMTVVLVGMLGLFRVVSISSKGSATAQSYSQALARAQAVLEAIRGAPKGGTTTVLGCLTTTTADQWATCEAVCQGLLPVGAKLDSCTFVTLSNNDGLNADSTAQNYVVVYDTTDTSRSTWAQASATGGAATDVQVTIGWNGANTTTAPFDHRVTLKSAIYSP